MRTLNTAFLKKEEKIQLILRQLYEEAGYKKYRMGKFEEYEMYLENKNFLKSWNIITFNDTDGRVLALKPDVTLSIVKNTHATKETAEKFYYAENVFRMDSQSRSYREINQLGLEAIGDPDGTTQAEVIRLAKETLEIISPAAVFQVSHIGFLLSLLDGLGVQEGDRPELLDRIRDKNLHELRKTAAELRIPEAAVALLEQVTSLAGPGSEVLQKARKLVITQAMGAALQQLEDLYRQLEEAGLGQHLVIDFSLINDVNYYSGLLFQGFAPGVPRPVLTGGYYGNLMKKFGRDLDAIGFAVYLDELAYLDESAGMAAESAEGAAANPEAAPKGAANAESAAPAFIPRALSCRPDDMLNIALPKGRLGDQVYELFASMGYDCSSIYEDNRKLIFENKESKVRYMLVKPSDVAIYVEHGACDIGVVGKDILVESKPDVYELQDLNIGKCRLAVAAPKGYQEDRDRVLRVATKFTQVTKDYYASLNREIETIHLNGSIELAPLMGLSDVIVDIVESGKTLKENNLEVIRTIMPISARLIANRASFQFKNERIRDLSEKVRKAAEER
ncbi:MAG: ATP phosphoribosyltransferase [Clostridiales bacterium]|nr:ATP phosphoribosyltransferase [Clostridiales bacterium]